MPDGEVDEVMTRQLHHYQAERRASDLEHTGECEEESTDPVPLITNADVWQVFEGAVDRPEPDIKPGRMLTGLTAYLETGRELGYEDAVTAGPEGNQATLEVRGTATFLVDWGDGTVTGPHDTPGGPYPDGTVTHVYTDRGRYTVQVTDSWTLQWRFVGGYWSAPATFETVPVTLDDFEVGEYRAARVTPDP